MSSDHVPFMNAALELADRASARGEVPVGAVVVKGGQIIASGYNLRESWNDPTAHAELVAVRRAAMALGSWRLEGCTVYVTLEPCPMCAGAMVQARVQRVVYGCSDPKGGFCGTLADLSAYPGLNHTFEVVRGVEEEACAQRLKGFFRDLRQSKERCPSG